VTSKEVLGQFIPLHYHYDMLRDSYRMTSFQQAIEHTVTPGMHVVDLGGGTGVLSYFAAMQGASVTYVERNPELVEVAERFLHMNQVRDRVTMVQEDAASYVPKEPVDVVVCEMLHSGLVREKQTEVIARFKANYQRSVAEKLPRFLPEATLLAIQPVAQRYEFSGFLAPVPLFQPPLAQVDGTNELSLPALYNTLIYDEQYSDRIDWKGSVTIARPGKLNAWRVITKNVLAVLVEQRDEICWHNQYLVVPESQPMDVQPGQTIEMQMSYEFGSELHDLCQGLLASQSAESSQLRRPAA